MATNIILTPDMITYEALEVLKNELVFAKKINRKYDNYFNGRGAKIGDTLAIRKPYRPSVVLGKNLEVQDFIEDSLLVKLDTQAHVGLSFTSKDLTLSMDDFSNRVIKPAMVQLANYIDARTAQLSLQVANSVGQLGQPVTYDTLVDASSLLTSLSVPTSDRVAAVGPFAKADLLKSNVNNFNPTAEISKIWKDAVVAQMAGFIVVESNNVPYITTGGAFTATVNGAGQSGNVIALSSVTNLKVGETITIDGVQSVNPVNRTSFGKARQFAVTAINGNNVTISPSIYASEDLQRQTVNQLPLNGATVSRVEGDNLTGSVNVGFHRDAFTLVTADLHLPEGSWGSVKSDPDSGISMRLWKQGDISTDQEFCRIDILFGVAPLRDDFAVRIYGR